MQLTEQHILTRNNSHFEAVDRTAFAAKNLYNAANYLVRQSFIFQGEYLNYYAIHVQMKRHEASRRSRAKSASRCYGCWIRIGRASSPR